MNTSESRWDRVRRVIGDDPEWVAGQTAVIAAAITAGPRGRSRAARSIRAEVAGAALMAAGLGVAARARLDMGDSFTMSPTPRTDAALVTSGAYAVVRHPMYSGLLLALVGQALAWRSAAALKLTAVTAFFVGFKAIREEQSLRRRHAAFVAYARRVRWRVLPGVF